MKRRGSGEHWGDVHRATGEQHEYIAEPDGQWTNVPTRTITAGGVEVAYRELGANNPGTQVVFLVHLAAAIDNWEEHA